MTSAARQATLQLAGVGVHLSVDEACAPGFERLLSAWSSAQRLESKRETQGCVTAHLDEERGEVVVTAGPLEEHGEFELEECHLALERGIYAELSRLVPPQRQMLHAGAVVRDGHGWLFIGPSGAGKSSLCLAAMQRGYAYLSDDVLVTDGTRVWGLARAIQFEPERAGQRLPSWLADPQLDASTYPKLAGEEDNSSLLFVPGRPNTAELASASELRLVALEHGPTNTIFPLSAVGAIEHLVSASYHRQREVDLGSFAASACRLQWHDPGRALTLLEEHFR